MTRLYLTLCLPLIFGSCSEPTSSDVAQSAQPMATATQADAPSLAPVPESDGSSTFRTDGSASEQSALAEPINDVGTEEVGSSIAEVGMCRDDRDCSDGEWCDGAGDCISVSNPLLENVPSDDMSRVGVASFEIVPEGFETWMDRSGSDCESNIIGRFDGRLDQPTPEDPCADTFQDLNGNGVFDAIWLGGHEVDRPAKGLDDGNPPSGRIVLFTRGDQAYVLIALDLFALDAARINELSKRLSERFSIPIDRFAIHVTGVWGAPDAVGTAGPSLRTSPSALSLTRRLGDEGGLLGGMPFRSGVDESWWQTTVTKISDGIVEASQKLKAASITVSSAQLPMEQLHPSGAFEVPDSNVDGEFNDAYDLAVYRAQRRAFASEHFLPGRVDPTLRVLRFDDLENEEPLMFLVGWSAAPSSQGQATNRLTADFPGWVRQTIETEHPGSTAVWLTGAASDTFRVRDDNFVDDALERSEGASAAAEEDEDHGNGSEALSETHRPIDDLGPVLARKALAALERQPSQQFDLQVMGRYVWLPVSNPRFDMAARLGVMAVFGRWVNGQQTTNAWARGADFPECGGFGCLRYRLDLIQFNEQIQLLTTPGALDQSYGMGRDPSSILFDDRLNLADLDSDGIRDERDDEIRFHGRAGQNQVSVSFESSVNPQTLDAIQGLDTEQTWLVGRTNGGIGSLRPSKQYINVFEGALDPLLTFIDTIGNAEIGLCQAGYPCVGDLDLGTLARLVLDAHERQLAQIPGSREAWCESDIPQFEGAARWRIEHVDGTVVAEGDDLTVSASGHIHTPSADLQRLGVSTGDMLFLPDFRRQPWAIGGLISIDLASHPNALDTWAAMTPMGGDMVYNAACELLAGGACPYPRRIERNPNRQLPHTPSP